MSESQEISFDLAIIGSGPAGYSTALRAAELGSSVVVIERDEVIGGTCLNRGCIPSKALITATRSIEDIHRAQRMGIMASIDSLDFGMLKEYRVNTVNTMRQGLASLLSYRAVTVLQGDAALTDNQTVHVQASPQQTSVRRLTRNGYEDFQSAVTIHADNIVIATGSAPRALDGIPFNGALIDSTQALELDAFPHNAVIIGSGAIALEFASMWNAAGCHVTLLIRKRNILSSADRRAAVALHHELTRRGITIIKQSHITQVETGDNLGAVVHYDTDDVQDQRIAGEVVLAAIGRTPNTHDSWFDQLNIARNEQGYVITDEYGATSLDHVWAIGDITAGNALAHRAFAQGIALAEHIHGLPTAPVNEQEVPQVIFSTPEFASIGMTYAQAQADNRYSNVTETVIPVLSNARMVIDATGGSCSLVSGTTADNPESPIVLGMHIVCPDASDLIAEVQQLIHARVPVHEAASMIHAHPTFSELIGETLLKADNRPLHTR